MTLEQASAAAGYSIATINGLENHGAGSSRLREKLRTIYAKTQLKAGLEEDDEFATKVAESQDTERISSNLFILKAELSAHRLTRISIARQLRELADQLDPPNDPDDPPAERKPVIYTAKNSQSQSQ